MEKHDFKKDLAFSTSRQAEEFWTNAYQQFFPDMVSATRIEDIASQKLGIDREIKLANGRKIRVEEKLRQKDHTDILFEFVSDDTKNTPGWIEKPLVCHYLAYGFLPSKRVYFFDWHTLQRAWQGNGEYWQNTYGSRVSKNNGYNSHSCPVPIEEVQRSMNVFSTVGLTVN